MSKRLDRWRARSQQDRAQLLVCRGGDCGSRRKHPGVDHRAQLLRCVERAADDVEVRATKCLDACDFSNVFVIVPSGAARRAGAKPTWIGRVLDPETTAAVIEQASGTPGTAVDQAVIRAHRFATGPRGMRHLAP